MNASNTPTSPLVLKQLELGPMKNYIYLIANSETKEAVVVDPAWDVESIKALSTEMEYKLTAMFITHGHPDHTNGIEKLLKTHDLPVYVSKHEASFYKPIGENIKEVDDSFSYNLGDLKIDFIHTPGHTPGSQCFLVDGKLVSGDVLFLDGCGRCDLPGGCVHTMYDSLYNKLLKLPKSTSIYPGHNYHHLDHDTLEAQTKTNPYLMADNLHQFVARRMG